MDTAIQTLSEALSAGRYEALIRVAQAICAHRDPKDLFCVLARELRQVIKFDGIGVAQYDEATKKMHWRVAERCHPPAAVLSTEFDPAETIPYWWYKHQQPLLIPLVDQETRFPRMMGQLKEYGIQSACALPLTTAHRRVGRLILGSEHPT